MIKLQHFFQVDLEIKKRMYKLAPNVLESQDGPYWPKRGIQRTLFKDWIKHIFDFKHNLLSY